jgi:hypothetical protein
MSHHCAGLWGVLALHLGIGVWSTHQNVLDCLPWTSVGEMACMAGACAQCGSSAVRGMLCWDDVRLVDRERDGFGKLVDGPVHHKSVLLQHTLC